MGLHVDETQIWKCSKHPSRSQKTGICPKCLRDRLVTLCPDCAAARPCACSPAPELSSSFSSSSSSFSLFSFSRGGSRRGKDFTTSATTDVETEPALRRTRSSAIPLRGSRYNKPDVEKINRGKINFWSIFTVNKSKKCDPKHDDLNKVNDNSMMERSRSVAVGGENGFGRVNSKQAGWYFPRPINALRHSKPPRSVAVSVA